MEKFDIQVTITVTAMTENEAEGTVMKHLKAADMVLGNPDIVEWELTEFVPNELKSCCSTCC